MTGDGQTTAAPFGVHVKVTLTGVANQPNGDGPPSAVAVKRTSGSRRTRRSDEGEKPSSPNRWTTTRSPPLGTSSGSVATIAVGVVATSVVLAAGVGATAGMTSSFTTPQTLRVFQGGRPLGTPGGALVSGRRSGRGP